MATTIDVDVDELCTRTVAKRPMTTPATGFLITSLSWNTLPASLPPNKRNAELRKLKEQMKRYKNPSKKAIFKISNATRSILSFVVISTAKKYVIRLVSANKKVIRFNHNITTCSLKTMAKYSYIKNSVVLTDRQWIIYKLKQLNCRNS